jgi:cellulose synthase/poly-beta-1,6-N-acetylglucosamine synthase-like glycosyltransferase
MEGLNMKDLLRRTVLNWRWWLDKHNPYEGFEVPVYSLTVAIPAHNDGALVETTILSVLDQTYNSIHPIQIILVNDGSTDDTREIFERWRGHPSVVGVIQNKKKSGRKAFAAMMAFDMMYFSHLRTDMFLALDGDAELAPDAIEKAMLRFNRENVSGVTGTVIARNHESLYEKARTGEYINSNANIKPAQNLLGGVLIASGCFSIFKTEDLQEVGGYLTRTLGEDLDLTIEMYRHGKKILYANDAVCVVVDPHTPEQYDSQITRWFTSYIQVMKVQGWGVWRDAPWTALKLHFYFYWSFIQPFFLFAVLLAVFKSLPLSIISFFAMWFLITWLPMLWQGKHLHIPWRTTVSTFIPMFWAQFKNIKCFYKVFLIEVVGIKALAAAGDGWGKVH